MVDTLLLRPSVHFTSPNHTSLHLTALVDTSLLPVETSVILDVTPCSNADGCQRVSKHTASFLPEVGDSCAPLKQWEAVISRSLRHTHEDRRFNSQRDYVRTLSRYGEEVVSEMSCYCVV